MDKKYLIASLSYVGVLVLVPILAQEYKDPLIALHIQRGSMLFAGEVIAIMVVQWFPRIGSVAFLALGIVSLAAFFTTVQGKRAYV